VVALAVIWFWGCAWTASKDLPAVSDEIAHITGGESYWRYGMNHLQFEATNGFLAAHWATLPLRLHPPVFPALPPGLPQSSAMIVVGNRLFYESGNNPAAMLSAGRAMMSVVGAALVVLIWWWARRLWGPDGGLLAAGLAAFCPTLLAHSGLVMSDVMASLFFLLTVTLWWNLLQGVSVARILLCGLSLGALLLSKVSSIIVAPMLAALLVIRLVEAVPLTWHWLGPRPDVTGRRKLALLGGAGVAVSVVAGFTIWAAFRFQFSMFANPATPRPVLALTGDDLFREGGVLVRVVHGLLEARLLPEAWLRGVAQTVHSLDGRLGFLNGRTYLGGTPGYFPYVWLVKTPLALFGLMALGLATAVSGRGKASRPEALPGAGARRNLLLQSAPLLVLVVIYSCFALTAHINIGHRHLLPLYAPMLILAGGAGGLLRGASRTGRVLVVALVAWFVVESLWIRPRYLSYFNPLAGGPANGYRHLVDSNVDVGQDLIALRKWLDASAAARGRPEPVFLSFFGPADPVAHGIRAVRFADTGFDAHRRRLPAPVRGGLFCISVTLFQGLYTLSPGPWTGERETLYRQLLETATTRTPSTAEATMIEHLQFARLRHVLSAREPDARVGHSILIFRLRDDEVAQALYAPLADLDRVRTMNAPR
jgi:4-amino-4-deoxy-L-arabinose transferase-like glycosyltransferase